MKDDKRIERLYAGLTGKESATLVFTHLSQGNGAEADRIRDLVPIKCYRMPDADHTDWFERLRRLTLYYGLERWRYQAHASASTPSFCTATTRRRQKMRNEHRCASRPGSAGKPIC